MLGDEGWVSRVRRLDWVSSVRRLGLVIQCQEIWVGYPGLGEGG